MRITRAHLEEDVGKNFHFERNSGVDFNRAGVPLMEIVSEPDITSADMAYEYLNALKEILVYGGVSDCDMEKGMVRCDVNVSVRPRGQQELGAKIEIKNMNSFSGVRRALEYEIPRQIEVLNKGGKLIQSTRRWDDAAGITEEMRTKEHAHDYRYFPEPDLMPFQPTEAWLAGGQEPRGGTAAGAQAAVHARLPVAGLRRPDVRLGRAAGQLLRGGSWQRYQPTFKGSEEPRRSKQSPTILSIMCGRNGRNKVEMGEVGPYPARGLIVDVTNLVENNTANSATAQVIITEIVRTGQSATAIIQEKGLAQVTDASAIEKLCDQAIAANPGPVGDYKAGKAAALNFLKGQVMKLSKGKANPALAGEILERKLKG